MPRYVICGLRKPVEERLQKILSRAGVASRRKAEEYMRDGRVTVNGQVVRELGSKADMDRDHIKVDGKLVHRPRQLLYLMLNKPPGCVTTMFDPEGRRKVVDLIHGVKERVYPVGRLDYNSEGLLLLTNDGDFANLIISASSEIPKTYWVKVSGKPEDSDLERLRNGIRLDGRRTAPAKITLLREAPNPWYEIVIIEGRQNQIRRMFAKIGHRVEKLKRVRIGFLELGEVASGEFRALLPREVERFRRLHPGHAASPSTSGIRRHRLHA
jgi:23S rRNA pseudouridine2605 synthase